MNRSLTGVSGRDCAAALWRQGETSPITDAPSGGTWHSGHVQNMFDDEGRGCSSPAMMLTGEHVSATCTNRSWSFGVGALFCRSSLLDRVDEPQERMHLIELQASLGRQ